MTQTATLPAKAVKDKPLTLRDHLAKAQPEFARVLPNYIPAERFVRTTQSALTFTRNINKVTNPGSLLSSCMKAAADGLILDGREAALVVDNNGEVQYRPMMRGLLKLAYNSGMLKNIVVECVRDGDVFDYSPTRADDPIIHKIDLKQERGEIYAVYALAVMKDGGVAHDVMTVADVNRIRDRSDAWKAFQAKKIKSTPWHTDWKEMARKTVFRRLSKYLPSSSDRDAFHQAVERIDEDFDFAAEDGTEIVTPKPNQKRRGAAAALLKDVTPPSKAAKHDDPPYDRETGEIIEGEELEPVDDI